MTTLSLYNKYFSRLDDVTVIQLQGYLTDLQKMGYITIPGGKHFSKLIKLIWDFDQPKYLYNKKKAGTEYIMGHTPNFYFMIVESPEKFDMKIFNSKEEAENELVNVLK